MSDHNLRSMWYFSVKVTLFICFIISLGYLGVMGEENKQKGTPPLCPPANFRVSRTLRAVSMQARLPEGFNGLAAKYPGDKNIEDDPDVIFVEKFNQGIHSGLNKIFKRWDSVKSKDIMRLSSDVPKNSADKHSLLMTHVGGKNSGGHLYHQLLPGYQQVFARFYVKFDLNCAPISHFGVCMGGYNPPTAWPQGGAGKRPDGGKRFTSQVDTYGKNWQWDFYTYWQGMHAHGDGKYWGTSFLVGGSKPPVDLGKWICVEIMLKMNNPVDVSNGEQAFWIDGKLWRRDGQVASHIGPDFPKGRWTGGWWRPDENSNSSFGGFRWRTIEDLAINFIWLELYIPHARSGHISKVWFDNVVVSKRYIGPIEPIR